MKILGCYKQLWPAAPGFPEGDIRDFTRDAPGPSEVEIAQYLRNGHQLIATMGVVEDVLGSGESILGGNSLFTDGEWVWRGDLWFYLRTYHLRLPTAFVTKVHELGFTIPQLEPDHLVELTDEIARIL